MLKWPLAAIVALSTASTAETVIYEIWDEVPAQPRGAGLFRAEMLKAHNDARSAVGARPLLWNDALAHDAATYAAKLARDRTFDHSDDRDGAEPQGENLWMGTRTAFRYAEMAGDWVDERRHFKPGRFPEVSRSGAWSDVGHYTQIIWHSTTSVGCGIAANADDEYVVCRYVTAGNVMGENPLSDVR